MSRRDDRHYSPGLRSSSYSHGRSYERSHHYRHREDSSSNRQYYSSSSTSNRSYQPSRHTRETRGEAPRQPSSTCNTPEVSSLPSVEDVTKEYKRQGHFDAIRRSLLDDFKQSVTTHSQILIRLNDLNFCK